MYSNTIFFSDIVPYGNYSISVHTLTLDKLSNHGLDAVPNVHLSLASGNRCHKHHVYKVSLYSIVQCVGLMICVTSSVYSHLLASLTLGRELLDKYVVIWFLVNIIYLLNSVLSLFSILIRSRSLQFSQSGLVPDAYRYILLVMLCADKLLLSIYSTVFRLLYCIWRKIIQNIAILCDQ